MKKLLVSTVFMAFFVMNAYAETCYEDKVVEGSTTCSSSGSKSADFSNSCNTTGDTTVRVEVECPETGRWVNVGNVTTFKSSGTLPSHQSICSKVGLNASDNNDEICASGRMVPTSGGNFDAINYKYGKQQTYSNGGSRILKKYTYGSGYRNSDGTWVGECAEGVMNCTFTSLICASANNVPDIQEKNSVVAVYCE